jgi:hypothetical protein
MKMKQQSKMEMEHLQTAGPVPPAQPMALGKLKDFFNNRVRNSALLFGVVPIGTAFGRWISRVIALPQLRKLATGEVPWTPLRKPLSNAR